MRKYLGIPEVPTISNADVKNSTQPQSRETSSKERNFFPSAIHLRYRKKKSAVHSKQSNAKSENPRNTAKMLHNSTRSLSFSLCLCETHMKIGLQMFTVSSLFVIKKETDEVGLLSGLVDSRSTSVRRKGQVYVCRICTAQPIQNFI